MDKNNSVVVVRWLVFMCLCDRQSVSPSLRKIVITFDSLDRPAWNFLWPVNSSQVIFGSEIWTPGPLRSGPSPKKVVSAKSISSRGFGAWRFCHTFTQTAQGRKQNDGSGILILIFGSRPQGDNQNFGVSTFFMKGTAPPPPKIRRRSLFVSCNFFFRCTPRVPVVPPLPGGLKIKSQNWSIFLEWIAPKSNFFFNSWFYAAQGPFWFDATPSKFSKRGGFPGSLKKLGIWGLCIKQNMKVTIKY